MIENYLAGGVGTKHETRNTGDVYMEPYRIYEIMNPVDGVVDVDDFLKKIKIRRNWVIEHHMNYGINTRQYIALSERYERIHYFIGEGLSMDEIRELIKVESL